MLLIWLNFGGVGISKLTKVLDYNEYRIANGIYPDICVKKSKTKKA